MYYVGYKIPNNYTTYCAWYGGDTPEEATENAIKSALNYHNVTCKREVKLTRDDINVTECRYSGDYETVYRGLQNDNS